MSRQGRIGATALALVACVVFVGLVRSGRKASPEQRLEELRRYAQRADERAPRTSATDALWARLADLDRRVQALVPEEWPGGAWLSGEPWRSQELDLQRARLALVEPCLAEWDELCASAELQTSLERGVRIARDSPGLLAARNWGSLLAWRAYFQAQDPLARERAGETLASAFDLAEAFDDRTPLGEMVTLAVEQRVLHDARSFVERCWLDPRTLRAALEPRLARVARAGGGEEIVLHELRAFFEIYGRATPEAWPPALEDGLGELDALLAWIGPIEDALALARLPADEFYRAWPAHGVDPAPSLVTSCAGALGSLHRQRSIVALSRVALAIEAHRARTGALPATLDELAGSFPDGVPDDPLGSTPFPWAIEDGHGRLGPTVCPVHGSPDRECDWPEAVEQLLAFEF